MFLNTETTNKQRRSHLRDILDGKQSYDGELAGLWQFFCEIFQDCCEWVGESVLFFIACLTRRFNVLLQIFGEAISAFEGTPDEERPICLRGQDLSLWKKIFTEHFITDRALVAMSGELVQRSITLKEHRFPRVVIADELRIHGRSLNRLLSKIEDTVSETCRRGDLPEEAVRETLDAFMQKLELRIYRSNSRSNLLLKRYARHQDDNKAGLCPPSDWRKFSSQCTKLIAHYPVNNVAACWSLCSPALTGKTFPEAGPSSDFRLIATELQGTSEQNYIWLYPKADSPKAACTVRMKFFERQEDGPEIRRLTVPYVICDDLRGDAPWLLHERILEDLAADCGPVDLRPVVDLFSHYDLQMARDPYFKQVAAFRWITETNDLVLQALLMRKFQKELSFAAEDMVCFDQLVRNFIYFSSEEDAGAAARSVRSALEALWAWAPDDPDALLRRYLDLLVAKAPSLDSEMVFGDPNGRLVDWDNEKEREHVIYALEDAISEMAFRVERSAYELYSNSFDYDDKDLTGWGRRYPFYDFLSFCQSHLTDYLEKPQLRTNLYQVTAVLVHAMDYGLIGMSPLCLPEADARKSAEYRCRLEQRAGEAALFILPRRYRVFLPVLEDIQSWRGNNHFNAQLEIHYFLRKLQREIDAKRVSAPAGSYFGEDVLSLEGMLSWLFYLIYWSGQRYEDWKFLWNTPEKSGLAEEYLSIYRG